METQTHTVLYGKRALEFSLTRSGRKSLEIAVTPQQLIEVVAPRDATLEKIKSKVQKRGRWIKKQQDYFHQFDPKTTGRSYLSGETYLYLGRQYRLKVVLGVQQGIKLQAGYLVAHSHKPKNTANTRQLLESWFLHKATERYQERLESCFPWFGVQGFTLPQIKIRKMEKRWGSCTSSGNILLNPRLIHAPKPCIDYVITHELCHLVHKNHSRAYFDLLSQRMPDWQKRKEQLEEKMA